MQARLGHVGQSLHAVHNLKLPSLVPWDLCKLSKDNESRDTPSKLADLPEERQLQICHVLQFRQQFSRDLC